MSNTSLSGPDLIQESQREREKSQAAVDQAVAAGERVRELIEPGRNAEPGAPRPERKVQAPPSS